MDERNPPTADTEFKGASLLISSLQYESDRGVILVASEYLSSVLEELLRLHLIADADAQESMLERQAPFGTFSSRIAGAYALGLIPIDLRKRLDQLRRIRNHCAHHLLDVTFADQNIRDVLKVMPGPPGVEAALADIEKDERATLRLKFVLIVSYMAGLLAAGVERAEEVGRPRSGVGFWHLRGIQRASTPDREGGGG